MELKIIPVDGYLLVAAPAELCLYSEAAKDVVESLIAVAEGLQPSHLRGSALLPHAVILVQNCPAHDCVSSWEGELRNEGIQKDLFKRILGVRWLFYLIRHSVVPWVYVSGFDTLGSHWELAMSGTLRYFLAPRAKVGFPEIACGAYVPGGTLEALAKSGTKAKEKWFESPVISAQQAFGEGLIQFCSAGIIEALPQDQDAISQENIQKSILNLLKFRVGQGAKKPTVPGASLIQTKRVGETFSQGFSGFKSGIGLDFFARRPVVASLQRMSSREQEGYYQEFAPKAREFIALQNVSPAITSWEACWQIVKDRTNSQRPVQNAAAVSRVAALGYFQPRYLLWLSAERASLNGEKKGKLREENIAVAQIEQVRNESLVIDLSEGTPPISGLAELISEREVLLTSSLPGAEFIRALELIYSRLERWLGQAMAAQLWAQQVFFTQGQFIPKNGVVLKWVGMDQLVVRQDQNSEQIFKMIGADIGGLRKPSLLWQGQKIPDKLAEVVSSLCERLFCLSKDMPHIPWELVIKSLLLEELIEQSRQNSGDLGRVCETLRKFGWGFIADEEAWHYFLKTMEDLTGFNTGVAALDEIVRKNNQALWEVGSWKQARMLARKDAHSQEIGQNGALISRSMAFFVGFLTELIMNALPHDDPIEVDQFVALCVGFPVAYGSPMAYLRGLGHRQEMALKANLASKRLAKKR